MAYALGYASTQPPIAGLAMFADLAAGVAAPFNLLSFRPSLARMLLRPGIWMVTLQQALAFLMLGASAWLTEVLTRQMGQSGLALILGCEICLGFVAWLHGIA